MQTADNDHLVLGLTVQRQAPDFAMHAQLIGTLEIDPSTNYLVVRTGNTFGRRRLAARLELAIRNREIALIEAAGQAAIRLGDEVWVGGGFVDAAKANVVSCTGRKQVFVGTGFSGP